MMNSTPNKFSGRFLFFSIFAVFLGSCGLRYEPQTPPEDRQLQRQRIIESKIKEEFAEKKMTYKSIAFGNTVTVKPSSFIKLDSLFEEKYKLEQQSRRNKDLEEQIAIQRLVCQTDTNEILYMEEHVFSLSSDSSSEVLSGNFSLNSKNEIRKVEFTQSYSIPSNLITYYTYYLLNESFMYSSSAPSEDEQNFYELYKTKAGTLFGQQKENFIISTLKLMKIARTKKSLEKQMFLEELTRNEVHEGIKDFKDAVFLRVDQVSKPNNEIDYYIVEYQFSKKTGENSYVTEKYVLQFDPYLVLLSKEKTL